jgi:hypothetical protein
MDEAEESMQVAAKVPEDLPEEEPAPPPEIPAPAPSEAPPPPPPPDAWHAVKPAEEVAYFCRALPRSDLLDAFMNSDSGSHRC